MGEKDEHQGRLKAGLVKLGYLVAIASVSGVTSYLESLDTTKKVESADQAAQQAAMQAEEIDRRIEALYDDRLKPVIESLLEDAEECKELGDDHDNLSFDYEKTKARVDVLQELFGRRRVEREYERRPPPTASEIPKPRKSAAQQTVETLVEKAKKRGISTEKGKLPALEGY